MKEIYLSEVNYRTVKCDLEKAELKHILRVLQCISHKRAKPWHSQTTPSNGPYMKYGKRRTEVFFCFASKIFKMSFCNLNGVGGGSAMPDSDNISLKERRLFPPTRLFFSLSTFTIISKLFLLILTPIQLIYLCIFTFFKFVLRNK